jgi:hypothetical protein
MDLVQVFGCGTGRPKEIESRIFQKYYYFITKKPNREVLEFISEQF